MPEFLAETYAPSTAAPRAGDLSLAAEQASQPGAPVRFLGAVVVPEEETCFCLYQAPSAGAVRTAMARAWLRPERVTRAVSVRPPAPAASRSPRPRRQADAAQPTRSANYETNAKEKDK
jgi:hypothetical protein